MLAALSVCLAKTGEQVAKMKELFREPQIYDLEEKPQIPKENQEYLFALHSSIRTVLHFP